MNHSQQERKDEFRLMLEELKHFRLNRAQYADVVKLPTLKNFRPTAVNMFTGKRQRILFYDYKPTFRGRFYTTKRVVIPLDGYLYRDYERLGIQMYSVVSRLFFVLVHTDIEILLVTIPLKPYMSKDGSLLFVLSGHLVILIKFNEYAVVETQIEDNNNETDVSNESGYSSDES